MATIAIVPSDVPSKRMLARRLGERLTAAGHRVVTVLPPGDPDLAASDGATSGDAPAEDVDRSRPGSGSVVEADLHAPIGNAGPRWRPIARWRATTAAADAVDLGALDRALDRAVDRSPGGGSIDLVIIDIEEYEATIAALVGDGPPMIVLCSFFDPWPVAGLGPNDAAPRPGVTGRARAALAWWVLRVRMRLYELRQVFTAPEIDRIAANRALARRAGARRLLTSRQWVHPFAARDRPMIVCNALELDIPHEPPARVHHIGSLLAPADPGDEQDRALVAAAERARIEGRSVVVCSFGTVMAGTPSPLVDRLGEVAGARPDIEFFVATDDGAQRWALDELPNVHAAGWLPQRALLPHADAAIVHSGNATLHECVAAGVPVLVYPFTINDQPRNAARVECHGIGIVGDRDGDDASAIARRLDGVLSDAAMRQRVADLAPAVLRYEDDGAAVAVVEELLDAAHHGQRRPT